jgi:hypothetical protein
VLTRRRAAAGVIDAQCSGTFTRTFSPALTITPQSMHATGTDSYSICAAGFTGTDPGSIIASTDTRVSS